MLTLKSFLKHIKSGFPFEYFVSVRMRTQGFSVSMYSLRIFSSTDMMPLTFQVAKRVHLSPLALNEKLESDMCL